MTWFRASSSLSTYVLSFVFALYSLLPAAFANKQWGRDVFAGNQTKMHAAISKRLSNLNNRLGGTTRTNPTRDKWALLVGVNQYQDTSIKPLRIARNDVLLVSTLLKEPAIGRFARDHVSNLVGRTATRDAVEQAILDSSSSLIKKALPSDIIFLYLSARTLPLSQEHDLCLCTYDTLTSEAALSGVKLGETLSKLKKRTQCGQIVCVLDCASVSKKDFDRPDVVSLEELSRKTGVSIISASELNEDTPACYAGTVSSFALYFANAIRNSSGACSLSMLVNYVQDNLNRESQELGTASQAVSFIPSETNPNAKDIVLGTAVRNVPHHVAVGHNVSTLALDRPDLAAPHRGMVLASNPSPPRIVNGKTPDDEDADESFFSKVDYGPWMEKMKKDIRAKWRPPKGLEQRHVATLLTIKRDGSIVSPSIVESSGIPAVDQSALDALKASSPLDPLPAGAPASVQVRYVFDWKVAHN